MDVGTNGRANDGSLFKLTTLKKAIGENSLNFPDDYIIVDDEDDAFPISLHLMRPFSRRNLSLLKNVYLTAVCLERARRLPLVAARFRVFRTEIEVNLTTVDLIVQAACIHNWLRTVSPGSYFKRAGLIMKIQKHSGQWHTTGTELPSVRSVRETNSYSKQASKRRKKLAAYFNYEGQVPWQMKAIGM